MNKMLKKSNLLLVDLAQDVFSVLGIPASTLGGLLKAYNERRKEAALDELFDAMQDATS